MAVSIFQAINEDAFLSDMFRPYVSILRMIQGLKVLDYGCGYGWGSDAMARAGALSVTGYDLDTHRINYAKTLFKHDHLQYTDSIDRIDHKPFDWIVLCHVLSNTSDTEQIASELSCLYRSGTVLFLAFKEVYIDKADRLIALLPLHSEKLEKRQRPLNHQNHIIEYKVIFC